MNQENVTYKYYLLGDTVPIRVSFNEKGHKTSAEVPDQEKGELVHKVSYLSRLERSAEVDEITKQEFTSKCSEVLERALG